MVMGSETASQRITEAAAELDRALMSGDPEQVVAHFTEDSILGESGAEDAVGREAIQQFLIRGNQKRTVIHHRLIRDDLLLVGDRAIEFGRFEEIKRLDGGREVTERGRTATDWRLGPDGRWRIARLVVSDLPAR